MGRVSLLVKLKHYGEQSVLFSFQDPSVDDYAYYEVEIDGTLPAEQFMGVNLNLFIAALWINRERALGYSDGDVSK